MRRPALILAVLALAGCGGEMESAPPEPAAETRPAAEREPAPAIEGTTLVGERLALADFAGKPVFVLVWSSW